MAPEHTSGDAQISSQGLPSLPEAHQHKGTHGQAKKKVRIAVCICGKCTCSKRHQCPIHHGAVAATIGPATERNGLPPQTMYQTAFQLEEQQTNPQRGLKPELQTLPTAPQQPMDLTTIHKKDYVKLPNIEKCSNFKPKQTYHNCEDPLNASTSYKEDFPPRPLQPNPSVPTLMRSTLPKISEGVNCYESCHKSFHKPWRGWHRPAGFGEMPAQNLFEGKFAGQSVSKNDFTEDISKHGQPSTSCKPVQKAHVDSGAKFDGTTTNNEFFVAPEHQQREILLRKRSKKNVETLEPLNGRVEHLTQYRRDNPGFWKYPPKQSMCAPHPDTLTLSNDTKMDLTTLHQSSYQAQQPRPSTSCKKNQDYYHSNAPFDGERRHQVDFKPVPPAVQLQLCQSTDEQAALFAYAQKDGRQMKTAYNFGRTPFCAETVNQSEYFKFKKPPAKIRHGDKSEQLFQPSTIKFEAVSESRARFVPLKGKPAESLKPLDSRFRQNSSDGKESKGHQCWGTTYKEEFPCRELPRRDICPAELLLA